MNKRYGIRLISQAPIPMWKKTERGFEAWAVRPADFSLLIFSDINQAHNEINNWPDYTRLVEVQEFE